MRGVVGDQAASLRQRGGGDEHVHVSDGRSRRFQRHTDFRIAPGGRPAPGNDFNEIEEASHGG